MTIKSRSELDKRGIELDLTGPDGNAYALLGYASRLGRQLGMDEEEISEIRKMMKSSDYENLVKVFESHFGEYVTLYR